MDYILSTPQNSNNIKKQHLTTSTSLRDDDCPYCLMKKKFNIGSSIDNKCFEHSIKISYDDKKQQQKQDKSIQKSIYMTTDQMIDALQDVQNSLDYYWQNLRQISGGNVNTIHRQLQPVLGSIKRVQQKIGKFFYDNTIQVSQIKPNLSQTSLNRKFHGTGSQKFLRVQFSNIFDPQQNTITQSIKQWVIYFHKILQLRQIPSPSSLSQQYQQQQRQLLPFETDLQMRIFKQSMQRKFIKFTQQIIKYQKKVKDVLSKLIYYMEKSSDNVPEKQIQQDILFIQGQHCNNLGNQNRQGELERIMLLQASTMEFLLQGGVGGN